MTNPVGPIEQLRRARDLMDRDFADDDLALSRIAAAAFLSKSYFVRAFTGLYGVSPGRYLTRRRIERAADLLRFANLSVTEVCHAVGFQSLGSFSSAFTTSVGQSPSAYQAAWRGRDQPRVPGCEILMWGLRPWPREVGTEVSTEVETEVGTGTAAGTEVGNVGEAPAGTRSLT